jgi:hypothetical protein
MKWKSINKAALMALLIWGNGIYLFAQDSTKPTLVLNVGYYMTNNKMVYIMPGAKTKIDAKFQPVKDLIINLYLDSVSNDKLIGKSTTNENGLSKLFLPPSLKSSWDALTYHKFIAVTEPTKIFEETTAEATITKSKIMIDTSSDGETKSITVTVQSLNGNEWLPVKDVEMKVGVNRLGGILSAGDEESYTTDSTGTVTVELKKTGLPGDEKGNIVLAAKVDENDQLGNLVVEKMVPWGKAVKIDNSFFEQRTLWSTRFRTPLWLLFMAYSIVIGVWGTIIYLVFQLIRIKKIAS